MCPQVSLIASPNASLRDMPPTLNRPLADLPSGCDVLVVGAGPAGSATALSLARSGFDVVLIDSHAFPRDKICGDGLIPDAHHALRKLGVLDEVMAMAQHATHVGITGPRGGNIKVPGSLAVLPRRELDLLLCRAAAQAGARMFAPVKFTAPIEEDIGGVKTVVGARLQAGDAMHELRAPWVVMATGAAVQATQAADMCTRRTPSGMALRGYVKNPAMKTRITALDVVWHARMKGSYGWIFPCPGDVFNIGVGVVHSHKVGRDGRSAMHGVNLREVFQAFTEVHAPARDLIATGEWSGELKGAPLRYSLSGALYSRAGLLVTGEAAGSTYDLTGEGIGKAMQTGILAAEAVIAGRAHALSDTAVRAAYEAGLLALKPRFEMYEKASSVYAHPWLIDLVVWSAKRSPARIQRLSGVLAETHTPKALVSLKSLARLVFVRS